MRGCQSGDGGDHRETTAETTRRNDPAPQPELTGTGSHVLCTRQAACTTAVLPGEATLRVTGCPQELVPIRSPNL